MTTNDCMMEVTPGEVWSVLADGWLYPLWVVGATRVRGVDADWPAHGSQIHHSVGVWPAVINDTTEVLKTEPEHLLRLRARAWPGGEAEVVIRITAVGPGSQVTIEEDAVSGPGALVPKPLRAGTIKWRNVESLRRLKMIAEGRAVQQTSTAG